MSSAPAFRPIWPLLFLLVAFAAGQTPRDGASAGEFTKHSDRGQAHLQAGEIEAAIADFQAAEKLARSDGRRDLEIKVLRQLGLCYWARQDRAAYLALNERALGLARELKDRPEQAKALLNIGSHYLGLGDYSRALDFYADALDLSLEVGNLRDQSLCRKNIGVILGSLGFPERALDYALAAHELDRRLGDEAFRAHGLNNLGEGFLNLALLNADPAALYEAVEYFTAALDSARKDGDAKTEMRVLNNIGSIHLRSEKYHSARAYFQPSRRLAEESGDSEALVEVLNNLGLCRLGLSDPDGAMEDFRAALERARESETAGSLWESAYYLGRSFENKRAYGEAAACYSAAMDAVDFIRQRIAPDDQKVGFMKNKYGVYEAAIELRLEHEPDADSPDRAGELFAIVERAKARAFLETLAPTRDAPEVPDPRLSGKEAEISLRISAIIRELSEGGQSPGRLAELGRDLKAGEEEYQRLAARRRNGAAGRADPDPPLTLTPAEVQDRFLDEGTAILEYFLGERASLLFLMTKRGFSAVPLPPRREVEASIAGYLEWLSEPQPDSAKGRPAAGRLARDLLPPRLGTLPASIDRLVIIPDGRLTGLPFETLPLSPEAGLKAADLLVSRFAISYAPSCAALVFLKEKKTPGPKTRGLLAFGDPVYPAPGRARRKSRISVANILRETYTAQGRDFTPLAKSRREILEISRFFATENRTLFLREDATEDNVRKAPLRDFQVIHFACHGFLDDKVPTRSALVLSFTEDSGGEGFLQVREIANLRLAAGLVVLSACDTARGALAKGEGSLGLTRAFFQAGARSVISTLWKVGDTATAEFMRRFYGYLSRNYDTAQALRLAKLSLLKTRFSAPFYWAAFVLSGHPSSTLDVR